MTHVDNDSYVDIWRVAIFVEALGGARVLGNRSHGWSMDVDSLIDPSQHGGFLK